MNTYLIDTACYETQVKYNDFFHTYTALAAYARDNDPQYITNQNNARVNLTSQVNHKLVEAELIKNFIKLKMTKTCKGFKSLLGTNKNFDSPNLNDEEIECLLSDFILNNKTEATIYLIHKYPYLYQKLTTSYVESRIFTNEKYTVEDIENDYLKDSMSVYRINEIDEYYNQLINNKTDDFTR